MEYREIYKALEHRWQTTPGVRFTDFSGWRQPKSTAGNRTRLLLLIEDQASMRRICVSHAGGAVLISHTPMTGQGATGTIRCKDQTQAAEELENLFACLSQAA